MYKSDLILSVDWLAFTFKPDKKFGYDALYQFYGMFPEIESVKEFFMHDTSIKSYYDKVYVYGDLDILIHFNEFLAPDLESSAFKNRWSQGVNVQVPSHGLGIFLDLLGIDGELDGAFLTLLRTLANRGCTLSRLDMCFDDFKKGYTTFDYIKAWTDGRLQSKYINSITSMGSAKKGYTMYFGSLKRRTKILRIYDKFLESNGERDCVRYEFELHNQEANKLMYYFIRESTDCIEFGKFLRDWVRIKEPNNNVSNISTVKDDFEWIKYLASLMEITISDELDVNSQFNAILQHMVPVKFFNLKNFPESPEYSVECREKYYFRNCLPTLAGRAALFGMDTVCKEIRDSIERDNISARYKRTLHKIKVTNDQLSNKQEDFFDKLDL